MSIISIGSMTFNIAMGGSPCGGKPRPVPPGTGPRPKALEPAGCCDVLNNLSRLLFGFFGPRFSPDTTDCCSALNNLIKAISQPLGPIVTTVTVDNIEDQYYDGMPAGPGTVAAITMDFLLANCVPPDSGGIDT